MSKYNYSNKAFSFIMRQNVWHYHNSDKSQRINLKKYYKIDLMIASKFGHLGFAKLLHIMKN